MCLFVYAERAYNPSRLGHWTVLYQVDMGLSAANLWQSESESPRFLITADELHQQKFHLSVED